jgi:hypothetical protein
VRTLLSSWGAGWIGVCELYADSTKIDSTEVQHNAGIARVDIFLTGVTRVAGTPAALSVRCCVGYTACAEVEYGLLFAVVNVKASIVPLTSVGEVH